MSENPLVFSANEEAPWHAGWRAARANFLPGLILQGVALALVLGYDFYPPAREMFAGLAALRLRSGLLFAIVGTALCGGVLPFLYMWAHPDTRTSYTWKCGLCFTIFWAYKGIEVDYWQKLLAHFIGNDVHVRTVATKVFIDQFIFCPFWAVLITVIVYQWQSSRFRWSVVVADFRAGRWYQRHVLPALLANAALWIPLTALIFSLPLPLQLPLFDLSLVFYTLLIAHITRRKT